MAEAEWSDAWSSTEATADFEPSFVELYRDMRLSMVRLASALTRV